MRRKRVRCRYSASHAGVEYTQPYFIVCRCSLSCTFSLITFFAGADGVHLQANPTQLALLKKQYEERKAALVASKSEKLRDKYGAAESVEAIPAELRMGACGPLLFAYAAASMKTPTGRAIVFANRGIVMPVCAQPHQVSFFFKVHCRPG